MLSRICLGLSFALFSCLSLHMTAQAEEISIQEAFQLLEEQQKVGEADIVLHYVVRHTASKNALNKRGEQLLRDVTTSLERYREFVLKGDKIFRIETDVDGLNARIARVEEAHRRELDKALAEGTQTYAMRIYISGKKWREERMPLPNDRPLDELVTVVQQEEFYPQVIHSYNGKLEAFLRRSSDKQRVALQGVEKQEEAAGFTHLYLGRNRIDLGLAHGSQVLTAVTNSSYSPERVAELTRDEKYGCKFLANRSEQELEVKVLGTGFNPNSHQMTYAMNHGLAMSYSVMRKAGSLVSQHRNEQFRKTDDGLWLAERMSDEYWDPVSEEKLVSLERHAFAPPEINPDLDPGFFDLALSDEFISILNNNPSASDEQQ